MPVSEYSLECRVEAPVESRLVASVLPFECKARTQKRTGDKSAILSVRVALGSIAAALACNTELDVLNTLVARVIFAVPALQAIGR
ncbi:MAG: hypothetical protein ACM309_03270 [Bacillota bacterium]